MPVAICYQLPAQFTYIIANFRTRGRSGVQIDAENRSLESPLKMVSSVSKSATLISSLRITSRNRRACPWNPCSMTCVKSSPVNGSLSCSARVTFTLTKRYSMRRKICFVSSSKVLGSKYIVAAYYNDILLYVISIKYRLTRTIWSSGICIKP